MSKLSSFIHYKILHRRTIFYGYFPMSLAAVDEFDAVLGISVGSRGNFLEINLYDADNELFDRVRIPINYQDAESIRKGINEAFGISRAKMIEEAANAAEN